MTRKNNGNSKVAAGNSRDGTPFPQKRAILADTTLTVLNQQAKRNDATAFQLLLQEAEGDLQQSLQRLEAERESIKAEQALAKSRSLIQFPKAVLKMTLREFRTKYDDNLLLDFQEDFYDDTNGLRTLMTPATVCQKGKNAATAKTVLASRRGVYGIAATPATVVSTARRGESNFMLPGGVLASATPAAAGAADSASHPVPSPPFGIQTRMGQFVSLKDPSQFQHLQPETKEEVRVKVNQLTDRMAKVLSQLEHSK